MSKHLLLAIFSLTLPLSASSVVSGGTLLSQSSADQLAAWLGEGDLLLTNVYSAAATPTSYPGWHTAVAPYARTFTLISTNLGVVGGYNPVNWVGGFGIYNMNPTNAGRTAFIFNLNSGALLQQQLGTSQGQYQTYNYVSYGPAFGGGHDLVLGNGFNYANAFGYGNGLTNVFGLNGYTTFTATTLETFSIAANPVPEPATFGLAGASLLALGLFRRRRRGTTAAPVKPALAATLLLVSTFPLSASSVVSGGTLLSQTHADQLAAWLGEGDLLLTNVYSGAATSTNYPGWHTTVDPYARTFTLISTNQGLLGGYNPVNWNANIGWYVLNPTDTGRTAFIFNLSTGVLQRQRLGGQIGQYQTFNRADYGPTFGGGHDLTISTFSGNYVYPYSYGDGTTNLLGGTSITFMTANTFETFSIAAAPEVPEPATFGLAGAALIALGLGRRVRHQ